jgi:lambda repressor-like predicted transcriptional regulator
MEILMNEVQDVRVLIKDHLRERGTTVTWLALKIGVSPAHLLNILSKKRTLSEANKQKINETLKTNF